MADQQRRPNDDPSSAPESGTVRNDTSGNQPAAPHERPSRADKDRGGDRQRDDPSVAGEER